MKIFKNLFGKNDHKIHVDEIAMKQGNNPILLSGAVIVESGSNENGEYVKFGDGTMVQWGYISKNLPFSSSWGTLYYSDMGYVEYPIEFKNTPYIYFSDDGASSTCFIGSTSGGSKSRSPELDVYRPVTGSATVAVSWLAIGMWK